LLGDLREMGEPVELGIKSSGRDVGSLDAAIFYSWSRWSKGICGFPRSQRNFVRREEQKVELIS